MGETKMNTTILIGSGNAIIHPKPLISYCINNILLQTKLLVFI